MPLIFPQPFPNENARDPIETWRAARAWWQRAQKFRAGQFPWSGTVPAATVRDVTFTDVSAGGTDPGVDNLIAGMWITITPPSSISPSLQVDYAYAPAAGTLTMQLRNGSAGDIAVAGTWSYLGYTF